MLDYIKKNNKKVIIILLLVIIYIITIKVIANRPLMIDTLGYSIFVKELRNPTLTVFMKIITRFSNSEGIILFTLLSLIYIKDKKLALTVPLNVIIATTLNQILKRIFRRPRPLYRLIKIGGFSFPSGHAMVSMAFYGYLLYLTHTHIDNKNNRIIIMTILSIIILLVGISRIYLGVHYLSDIITGYSISIIYLIIYTKLLKKLKIPK